MSTINQKPNVRAVWASAGSLGAVDVDRVQEGWVEEIPPSEVANWIENRQDTAIKYLFQEGFAEWDSAFEYRLNSLVKYDGKVYIATLANSGRQPDIENSFWSVAFDDKGSAAAVQATVDSILNTEGFLNLYVSKATPVMDGNAVAPSFKAAVGTPTLDATLSSVGHSFNGAANTGMFYTGTGVDAKLGFYRDGVLKAIVPKGSETVNSEGETLVRLDFLKAYLNDIILAQVGELLSGKYDKTGGTINGDVNILGKLTLGVSGLDPSTKIGYTSTPNGYVDQFGYIPLQDMQVIAAGGQERYAIIQLPYRFPTNPLNYQATVKTSKIGTLTDTYAQVVDCTQTTITIQTSVIHGGVTTDGIDGVFWAVKGY